VPVLLAVSKADRLADPARMLPFLQRMAAAHTFAEIVPVSAQRRRNLGELARTVAARLPEQPPLYEPDTLTDRSERFLAAEMVREKLFRLLGDEVPYGSAVVIEKFAEEGSDARPLRRIHAAIVVEKDGHKAIVIGKGGEKLKEIATGARHDMERLFGGKVYLEVWVKVRGRWTEDEALVKRFGYDL
jgi:GTP-binding protein Era